MPALRLGVIGVGHLGKEHARIVSGLPGVMLAGVADVNAIQAEAVAQRCGTKAYTDYRSLLSEIDAAVIAVPTTQHYAIASDVMSSCIPALVEKPLAANLEEADELLAVSRKHGAMLQVGHIERFNPVFEALQARPLTPKYVSSERIGGYSGRSTDVGVVLDLMIHDIDLLLALVRSPAREVSALGISVLGGHEDLATARIVFQNGCMADLHASRVAASPLRRMRAWGPEGYAEVDFAKRKLTLVQPSPALCEHRASTHPFDNATLATLRQDFFGCHLQLLHLDGDARDQLTCELHEFVRCVRTGEQPRVRGEEGRNALELATRILDSIQSHCWDGHGAGAIGPHAFALPPAPLFTPMHREAAA
jgi:predicted dehydrogenase